MASNKRVTDSYNEKVRARIFGLPFSSSSSSSSGSEHDGEYGVGVVSPCLSYLVQNFLEEDSNAAAIKQQTTHHHRDHDSDSDSGEFVRPDPTAVIRDVINPIVFDNADHFRSQLLAQVTKAVDIFSFFRKNDKSIFHRNLMAYLREIGYNAGVCKAKWSTAGNLTAGSYEFLDVVSPQNQRYIIDVEFSGEFEIARETESYRKLRVSLPRVFVCRPEDLKRILRVMCDEARRSMKANDLTLPPWRKNRFMQMKWLGPYRRCTSHAAAATTVAPPGSRFPVKCRAVGFDVGGGESGRFLLPPAARTR